MTSNGMVMNRWRHSEQASGRQLFSSLEACKHFVDSQGGGVGFGPEDEAIVERAKTQAGHACDEGENPLHGRRSPW